VAGVTGFEALTCLHPEPTRVLSEGFYQEPLCAEVFVDAEVRCAARGPQKTRKNR
jgi:hypothetical protein